MNNVKTAIEQYGKEYAPNAAMHDGSTDPQQHQSYAQLKGGGTSNAKALKARRTGGSGNRRYIFLTFATFMLVCFASSTAALSKLCVTVCFAFSAAAAVLFVTYTTGKNFYNTLFRDKFIKITMTIL